MSDPQAAQRSADLENLVKQIAHELASVKDAMIDANNKIVERIEALETKHAKKEK